MGLQDKLKLSVAVVLFVAGIAGYYIIAADQPWLRGVSLVAGIILAIGIVALSLPGKHFVGYAQDSLNEAKKVVWPSRKEALQMTGLVFLFVFILALFMWLVDSGISWVVYDVLLGRGG